MRKRRKITTMDTQARYFQTLCKKKTSTCRHRCTLEGKTMQQMVFCQFAMEVMVLMLMLRSSFVMEVMVLDIAMSFVHVVWRFGGIARGHFPYPPLTATRPAASSRNGPSFPAQIPTKR